ncbi:Carbohydrate sulfotransferase 14 [Holothuria leucospilota]|uniref:Carbohydrate sulfotransferase n=1 Tax=Holothuria leucospilota TaxID=206669 RepID=A0A9Q1CER6_HOLLE|nr:Carbohydrate sulfotransferase 14 [Holothuria leucospilota]
MGGKKLHFLVFTCTTITMMLLITSYGIIPSSDLLKSQVLRGDNETMNVLRPKTAKQVANITEIWKQQKVRLIRLKTVCENLNRTSSFTPPEDYTARLLVNDHDGVLFGYIPKVGCKTWKGIFSESNKAYGQKPFLTLSEYNVAERTKRLQRYKKVLFVRDPLIRFLSAYLSKFRNFKNLQKTWEKMFGFKILESYRPGSEELLKKTRALPIDERPFLNVTLTEFIRFITDLGDTYVLHAISDHWLPQHIVSHVCEIPYDFIGKYENLASEAPFVLNWVGMASVVQFPEIHLSKAATNLVYEYSNISLDVIEDLRKYYSLDFELFGYDSTETIAKVTRDIFNMKILDS